MSLSYLTPQAFFINSPSLRVIIKLIPKACIAPGSHSIEGTHCLHYQMLTVRLNCPPNSYFSSIPPRTKFRTSSARQCGRGGNGVAGSWSFEHEQGRAVVVSGYLGCPPVSPSVTASIRQLHHCTSRFGSSKPSIPFELRPKASLPPRVSN